MLEGNLSLVKLVLYYNYILWDHYIQTAINIPLLYKESRFLERFQNCKKKPESETFQTRVNYSRGLSRTFSSRHRQSSIRRRNLRKTKNLLASHDIVCREDRTQAQMKAIVPMLVMVVTVFILCWTPILIFEVTFHLVKNVLNKYPPGTPSLRYYRAAGIRHSETYQNIL